MSIDNIRATPPLSRSGAYLFPSSSFPFIAHGSGRKESSKVSSFVYRHSGAICPSPPSYGHWQVLPRYIPPSAQTVPDSIDKTSHGCQLDGRSSYPPIAYNLYPTQSVDHDPLLKPRQGRCHPDSPWPDGVNRDDGILDRYPAPFLAKNSLSSAISSPTSGVGSPLLSVSSGAASIPGGRQSSGSPVSNLPVPNLAPCWRSQEDRQHQEAWTSDFSGVVSQGDANRYRYNDVQAIVSYGSQESSHHPLYKSPRILRPDPVSQASCTGQQILSSSWPSQVDASNFHATSPPFPLGPQLQTGAAHTRERPKKKLSCPKCKKGFSQSQVLRRHIKDLHEPKRSCSHCSSFKYSRGRPYTYRNHLETHHPEEAPLEAQQTASSHAKESLKPHALVAGQVQNANYAPPLTSDSPLYNMSYHPWAN